MYLINQILTESSKTSFSDVKEFLEGHNMLVKEYEDQPNIYLVVYTEDSDMSVAWIRECRGIIMEKETNRVVCHTFNKSLDYELNADEYENEEAVTHFKEFINENFEFPVQYQNSIDGTQIRVYNYEGTWYIATTRTINAYYAYWQSKKSFGELFDEVLGDERDHLFAQLDENNCYCFVLKHTDNRIVVHYDEGTMGLTHVLTRNVTSGEIVDQHFEDIPCIDYLETHELDNVEGLMELISEGDLTREGVMLFQGERRLKAFDHKYRLYKEIIDNAGTMFYRYSKLRQSGLTNTYIQDFPEHTKPFLRYELNIIKMAKMIQKQYYLKNIRHEITNMEVDFQFRPLIYQLHGEYLESREKTDIPRVISKLDSLHPKQLCFIYNKTYLAPVQEPARETVNTVA